jgi:hypothetical protein
MTKNTCQFRTHCGTLIAIPKLWALGRLRISEDRVGRKFQLAVIDNADYSLRVGFNLLNVAAQGPQGTNQYSTVILF